MEKHNSIAALETWDFSLKPASPEIMPKQCGRRWRQ